MVYRRQLISYKYGHFEGTFPDLFFSNVWNNRSTEFTRRLTVAGSLILACNSWICLKRAVTGRFKQVQPEMMPMLAPGLLKPSSPFGLLCFQLFLFCADRLRLTGRMSASSSVVFHLCLFPQQDNLWKYALNSRANQDAIRAFDMVFIIGQRSYEGYEYYDFFDQVFERLKKHPFWSNLTSETEVRRNEPFILLKRKKKGKSLIR